MYLCYMILADKGTILFVQIYSQVSPLSAFRIDPWEVFTE